MNDPSETSDPRAWLTSLEHFGIKLGLSSIRAICQTLGHPERQFRSVHIAGTNGKGSVAAMADAGLRAAGHRVGRYTSPHLVRLEERITIGGEPVSPGALDAALEDIRGTVTTLRRDGALDVHPTFFEVTTAAAFLLFARARIELGVIEVGLGGRFDATNVLGPAVAAITSIALDHEQHLGPTLEAIAFEKAGIIKHGVPVVIGELPDEARRVVERACAERGAPLHDVGAECSAAHTRNRGLTTVCLQTVSRRYPPIVLALRGDHQVQNASVAVRLLEIRDETGIHVPGEAVATGLATARWPGRLDLVDGGNGHEVLIDGAHTPAGAAALASYLRSEWPTGLPLVFGAMRDKDLEGVLRALAPVVRPLILTTAPGVRAADAEDLARVARSLGIQDLLVCRDIRGALDAGWDRAPLIAAAGSLYLAGHVLALFGSAPAVSNASSEA